MNITDIYSKTRWILMVNFNIKDRVNYFNADFKKDLGLGIWEVNLLMYLIERNFNVRIKNIEGNEITRLDQIVSLVYAEKRTAKRLKQIA